MIEHEPNITIIPSEKKVLLESSLVDYPKFETDNHLADPKISLYFRKRSSLRPRKSYQREKFENWCDWYPPSSWVTAKSYQKVENTTYSYTYFGECETKTLTFVSVLASQYLSLFSVCAFLFRFRMNHTWFTLPKLT